jgi:hypothetical protein
MIRALVLGAALLFAGHALAASYTCHGKDDVYLCEADDFMANTPLGRITALPNHVEIPATKGDIDAINKRLDEIKHILRCLNGAVRPSEWITERCQ